MGELKSATVDFVEVPRSHFFSHYYYSACSQIPDPVVVLSQ